MEVSKGNAKRCWIPVMVHCKCYLFLFVQLLLINLVIVSGQQGDGVTITRTDYLTLKSIQQELVDSNGYLQRSWNDSGSGACSGKWAGIKCAQGHVIAIQLPWKGLGGQISEKIGKLQALRKLSLHDNLLSGPIPASLGSLPNIRGIYLFNNRLSGTIGPSFGQSPYLQALDISSNALSGTIPPSLASSTRIYRLNLSYNSFSGSIPVSFTHSSSLAYLALEHNNLSGSIPDTWGGAENKVYQLQTLTLDHNALSGPVPVSLSKLNGLEVISLGHNQLNAAIPNEIGTLSHLLMLDLSYNALNGSLPSSFANLTSLALLDLEENQLSHGIPDSIVRLQNLSVVNLKGNHFTGKIPSFLGNISSISQLDLSYNNFSGEIPDSLANLSNLTSFNVSYNNLSGSVPSSLSARFNSRSFEGNLQLCGYSNSTLCLSHTPQVLPPSPQETPKHHEHHRRLSTKDIILIAVGVLLAVLVLCCILFCCLIRKRAASKKNDDAAATGRSIKTVPPVVTNEVESSGGRLVHFDGPFVFTADDLLCATAEIMGKSTYGTAYKATLEDDNQVLVKRLREKAAKGQKEFEAEVAPLGKIRHPNLLALRAYYLGPKGEKLLVFDCMTMGSLASFLHARGPETVIDWPTRKNIAIGIAQGLHHLHTQEDIIHGNLTSSSILLDDQTNPHIAEVGLNRLMTAAANTNVIATAGALGYRAPELAKIKKPTTNTDIYSFGVIILELLTGQSPGEPISGMDLPQWVASIVKEEWTNEVFDLELMKDEAVIGDELLNTLKLALHCVDPSSAARPNIGEVLQHLQDMKLDPTTGSDESKTQSHPPLTSE